MKKDELLEIIMSCNRCGVCQEVCPTYIVSGVETNVARGRNRLIRLGLEEQQFNLDNEPELEKIVNECLLCKACEVNCPSGVPTPEIISNIRFHYTTTKGLPWAKKIMYRGIFSDNRKISLIRNLARIYQKSGINKLVKLAGLFNKTDEMLPDLPKENVRAKLPVLLKNFERPKHKVAYFLGCSVNNFFSSIGIATIKVLQENDCQVIVPDVNCCGAPHQSAGDRAEFIRLAKNNIKKLNELDVEAIIVDCSTCGSIIKEYEKLFANDKEYQDIIAKITAKIQDISSYLLSIDFKREMGQINEKVTYHDPCHGIRFLKVKDAPREILKSIPGIKFIEMKEADMCCGGAGSYGIFNPKLSRDILARKMENYKESEAGILATSCPACTMQLSFGLKLHKLNGQIKHPVELLAEAYELKKSSFDFKTKLSLSKENFVLK
jgi:glycolate oxidase iron-sulfur subunit